MLIDFLCFIVFSILIAGFVVFIGAIYIPWCIDSAEKQKQKEFEKRRKELKNGQSDDYWM